MIVEPEIHGGIEIDSNARFLILMSDGLYNALAEATGTSTPNAGKADYKQRGTAMIPKKVELLIRFFEPFWISRVFHFFLRTFAEVEHLPDPLGASDETYT